MICKTCGYETNENFDICPSCGEKEVKSYSLNMPEYFKNWGNTFEIDQNEIKMSRNLNGGNFNFWPVFISILSFFLGVFLPIFIIIFSAIFGIVMLLIHPPLDNINSWIFNFYLFFLDLSAFFSDLSSWLCDCISNFPLSLIISGIIFVLLSTRLTIARIKINSTGITIKILFKKYFLPKDKIDSIICRSVTRKKGKYFSESLYDIFIIMKDKSISNKHDLDTGLCYKEKIHVDYLIDMFNERLGFI